MHAGGRRADIDAARALLCLLLFVFHAAKVFDPDTIVQLFHVRGAQRSETLGMLARFIDVWHMPAFFFLAGWSALGAVARRSVPAFLKDRAWRLLVPLVLGIVILGPPIKYLELRSGLDMRPGGIHLAPDFDDSYLLHLRRFFTNLTRVSWAHLWFLFYLFAISAAAVPVLRRIARGGAVAAAGSLALIVPAAAIGLGELALRSRFPDYRNFYGDWANLLLYTQCFVLGALVARHAALDGVLVRHRAALLACGVLASAGVALLPPGSAEQAIRGIAVWGMVAGGFGLLRGVTVLPAPLRHVASGALSIYVLHQLPVVAIAYWTVGAGVPVWAGFAIIALGGLAATLALHAAATGLVPPWLWSRPTRRQPAE